MLSLIVMSVVEGKGHCDISAMSYVTDIVHRFLTSALWIPERLQSYREW